MKDYIIGFVLGVVACLLVLLWCYKWPRTVAGSGETEIVLDSVYVARAAEPVHISGRASSFEWRSWAVAPRLSPQIFLPRPVSFPNRRESPVIDDKTHRAGEEIPAYAGMTLKRVCPLKRGQKGRIRKDTIPPHDFPLLFTARLDTIFHLDTISIRYDYPENLFTFSLHPRPDSVLFKQIVVRPKAEAWWVKPVLLIGGCVVGVVVGRVL